MEDEPRKLRRLRREHHRGGLPLLVGAHRAHRRDQRAVDRREQLTRRRAAIRLVHSDPNRHRRRRQLIKCAEQMRRRHLRRHARQAKRRDTHSSAAVCVAVARAQLQVRSLRGRQCLRATRQLHAGGIVLIDRTDRPRPRPAVRRLSERPFAAVGTRAEESGLAALLARSQLEGAPIAERRGVVALVGVVESREGGA